MPKKHCQSAKTRKRKGKDLDEILEDQKPEKAARLEKEREDPDLPGEGKFYCSSCDRHFISEKVQKNHKATKAHKRRLKMLTETPYSHKEAEAAGGVGTFNYDMIKPDVVMKE